MKPTKRMHLLTQVITLSILSCSRLALTSPIKSIQQGSKHNLYLSTCTRRSLIPDCLLVILCSPQRQPSSYTAVAYFANGPIDTGPSNKSNTNPTQLTLVSQPVEPWEGTPRVAQIDRVGVFESTVNENATALEKGQIAGTAKLGSEEFVCFKNGVTMLSVREGGWSWGEGTVEFTTDYWCPSIQM